MATLVVNKGKEIIVDRIMGAGTEPKFIAWGTGAGTAAAADTTLFTEGPEARTTGTSSKVTTTTTNDTYQVTGTVTATGTRAVTNAGLFDVVTSSSGNMFVKGDFTTVNLSNGDSIAFTIKVQFS